MEKDVPAGEYIQENLAEGQGRNINRLKEKRVEKNRVNGI